jgi:mRNA interferase RelE/StbE
MEKPGYAVLIERTAERELRRLPADVHDRVVAAIIPLATNPRPQGSKKLTGTTND